MSHKISPTKKSLNSPPSANVAPSASAKNDPATASFIPLVPWYCKTWALATFSSLLLWAAFPPLGLSPLAWIAPLGWLRLIQQDTWVGKRPYLTLWCIHFLHWLALLYGVTLAHPILHIGWLALSAYLAIYPTLFIALSRVAVRRWRLPVALVAPLVWVGLETIRSHLLTGFALALLGHTQVRWTTVIQIADLFGAYGVSFVVMFVAASLAQIWSRPSCGTTAMVPSQWRPQLWPCLGLLLIFALVETYGLVKLRSTRSSGLLKGNFSGNDPTPPLKVALIQHSIDTVFEQNAERAAATYDKYRELTIETCRKNPDVQLVVWPESMLSANSPAYFYEERQVPPAYRDELHARSLAFKNKVRGLLTQMHDAARVNAQGSLEPKIMLLAGCDALEMFTPQHKVYNCAMLIDSDGEIVDRYSKMHRVMFGEYIPFGDVFPWLYRISPLPMGLTPGQQAHRFEVAGTRLMANVCFESTVPHLLRRQFAELRAKNETPQILVNVSNDGWFWGSNLLDLHLTCSVFRAVELRRPVLIAANTGLSAAVDSRGRIQKEAPRRQPDTIVYDVTPEDEISFYARFGDLTAWLCSIATMTIGLAEFLSRFKKSTLSA